MTFKNQTALKLGEKIFNFIKEMHIKSTLGQMSLNRVISKSLMYFVGKIMGK